MTRSELIALSEVSLFKDVDIVKLESFFSGMDISSSVFKNGQIIQNQGDPCIDLPIILTGEAGACMTAPNGKLIRIETLKGPTAAATAVLFSTEHTFPVSLFAEGELHLIKIPVSVVLSLMHEFPDFLKSYLRENGDKLVFLSEKIRLFQFKTLRQKLIGHILMLSARNNSDEFRMIYSREDLSQLMAVARPSLSREISQLVNDGYIEAKGRNVRIQDRKALMSFLSAEG